MQTGRFGNHNFLCYHTILVGEADDLAKVEELLIDDIDVTDCSKDLETSVVLANYLPDGLNNLQFYLYLLQYLNSLNLP